MGLQPFYGNEISEEYTAGADLPYYTLVTYHATDKTKVIPAPAGSVPFAIVVPSEDDRMPDGNGNMVKRDKFRTGETPTLYSTGIVYVILGETVTEGQECIPGTTAGRGYAQDKPALTAPTLTDKAATDFTDWTLAETPTNVQINAAANATIDEIIAEFNATLDEIAAGFTSVLAAINNRKNVIGEYLQGGNANDIVPVLMK